jgi:iron complex outermembrane receptor protein
MIFRFHKINKKALIFSAFFLLYTIAIRGQQDTIVVLDSFVVTASRLPQPKNSIHTHTISSIVAALAQGTSINDFIQAAPGIFTMSKTNYAQDTRITSRGFGARSSFGIRGIKIWVDEVPETTPDGQSQLDNLDYSMLHHMEILRGPDAALYGNVSGAMIKISPSPFDSLNQGVRLRLASGSNGFRQAGIQLIPKSVRWKWHMGYTYQASDGYRDWSKFRNHIGNIRGRYVKGNHELKILINGVFNPQSQDPGALNENEITSNPRQARTTNLQYKAGENLHQERIALIYKKVNNSTYHQVKALFS